MYTPNFQDKRINKRCRKAIGFTRALLSEEQAIIAVKHIGVAAINELTKLTKLKN